MTERIDDGMLFDYLEGLLDEADKSDLEARLRVDSISRDRLEELSALLAELRTLSGEREPTRDLWPEIEARLTTAPAAGSEPAMARWSGRRRVSFPISQLIAAGLALIIVSGGTVWLGMRAMSGDVAPSVATMADTDGANADAPVLFAGDQGSADYDRAVAELEAILEAGRDQLSPETVEVLERSLGEIDRAILEAREALREDPASATLGRILSKHLRTKLDVLRRAAAAVQLNA